MAKPALEKGDRNASLNVARAKGMAERLGTGGSTLQLPDGRSLPKLSIPEGGTSLEEVERALVELAMAQAEGNQTHAARLLDISRDALRYKLKKFGLMHAEEDEPSTANS